MDYNKLIHDKYTRVESKGHKKHHHHDSHHEHHLGNHVFGWILGGSFAFVAILGIIIYFCYR